MKQHRVLIIVAALLALVLTGCHTSRKGVEQQPAAMPTLEQIETSYKAWDDVEMPVKIELTAPKKLSISGTAKMISGDVIFISLRFFGFEVGNLWLNNDSVQIVAKPMYFKEGITSFTSRTGLNIADIQSLMFGRSFSSRSDLFKPEFKINVGHDGNAYIEQVVIEGHNILSFGVQYAEPAETPAGPVSPQTRFNITVDGREVDFTIKWNTDRAKWNRNIELKAPKIPEGGEKLSSAQVLKILEQL